MRFRVVHAFYLRESTRHQPGSVASSQGSVVFQLVLLFYLVETSAPDYIGVLGTRCGRITFITPVFRVIACTTAPQVMFIVFGVVEKGGMPLQGVRCLVGRVATRCCARIPHGSRTDPARIPHGPGGPLPFA